MISKKLEEAINEQINKELYSEYLYLAMAAHFDSVDLPGFANFFKIQVQEERFHAMKFYDFLNERGGKVVLKKIDKPQTEFESPLDIFKISYKHEQYVSDLINKLMDLAIAENDHAVRSFLNWYVDEQVEEEASMSKVVNQLKWINGQGNGLLMLDKELATRVFTPPAK
ncbi:MAG: ferritin [Candidatus Cloacimonadota bacterium]|nr:ferritin [Candidatus Cloacimonadota bacterium]